MAQSKQAKGLIRSLNRSAVRDDKGPRVRRKTITPREPTICARCGATYLRRTWRHDHTLSDAQLERRVWGFCPACQQVSHLEGQGRLLLRGTGLAGSSELIRRRIENVSELAGQTQPERRLISIAETAGGGLEVLTTSQKLAHRIAHELKKAFGGHTAYQWSDDGSLFATWDYDRVKRRAR